MCLNQWIDLTPLVYRISQLIEVFGGITYAFDMEWKIRFFVVEVLNFALCQRNPDLKLDTDDLKKKTSKYFKFRDWQKEHGGLKIDGEKAVEVFNARV